MKITDQLNNSLELPLPAKRIISLVPSQTELLFWLGCADAIVGITQFCLYPEELVQSKTKVGGTKNFKFDLIDSLSPDLIIGNKEENTQEGIRLLQQRYPVWLSDVNDLTQALEMIDLVGLLCGQHEKAIHLCSEIKQAFAQYQFTTKPRVAYFIWKKPWMIAGSDTFIDSMLQEAGFTNVFAHKNRYPEIDLNECLEAKPDLILLSSEPFPFRENHVQDLQNTFVHSQVILVDATPFSWYGNRLLHTPAYFRALRDRL